MRLKVSNTCAQRLIHDMIEFHYRFFSAVVDTVWRRRAKTQFFFHYIYIMWKKNEQYENDDRI